MAKLVDVMKENQILNRRQLPLVIDENLTMVLDLSGLNLVCDNASVRGRQLEDFLKKYAVLSRSEVAQAFRVTYKHCLDILNQTIPCIGCRKSVERVFADLSQSGYPALSPLLITEDGILTIQQDYLTWPNHLCSLLHGHSAKLNNLAASWPGGRGKATRRCALHSLDSARCATRPPLSCAGGGGGGGWRAAWDCMRGACKEQVALIEAGALLATLETYLRKHRFCGECRTKVMRAYSLLVEEKEPQKEKGFVAPLYAGIRRCLADKHIHLELRAEFIGALIARAEPELIGNRRERHAKTLEIAQEEVLTCIGICVYERLHKIQMKLREEQCTYQVLAAVAVEALCRNFEMVVEEKQGVSQLELCYLDMIRDDQVKQQRRELKKLKKRKRREERKQQLMKQQQQLAKETFECENCAEVYTEDEEHACPAPPPVPSTKGPAPSSNTKPKSRKGTRSPGGGGGGAKKSGGGGLKENSGGEKTGKSKTKRKAYSETKTESVDTDENCVCDECSKETSSLKVKKLLSSAATQKKTKTSNAQSDSNLKASDGPNNCNGDEKVSKKSSAGDSQAESFTSSKKSSKQVKKLKSSDENTTRTSGLQNTSSGSSVNSVEGLRDAFGNLSDNRVRDGCGNHSNNQDKYAFGNSSNNSYGNQNNKLETCGNPSNNNVRIPFGNARNNQVRDACGNHSNNNVRNALGNHCNALGSHGNNNVNNAFGNHSNTFGSHGNATECSIASDGGYTSGNNSTLSSPANSEVACSDGFCNHEGPEDCPADSSTGLGSECDDVTHLFHSKLSLEQMLHSNGCQGDGCCDDGDEDEDEGECWIPREEVEKFRARVQNVEEKRQRLRATLMQRFQNMCDRSRCPF